MPIVTAINPRRGYDHLPALINGVSQTGKRCVAFANSYFIKHNHTWSSMATRFKARVASAFTEPLATCVVLFHRLLKD